MKLPIPAAAIEQHVIALGKTRSGKSSKMRVIVEYFLDRKTPVCIIDPKGDWWGLKSSADGKSAGYPIIIFGSEYARHADVRINATSGAEIGRLVATGNRPALIDLKGMKVADRNRFFIGFAESYFRHAAGERVLMIDEVHNFAPQGKMLSFEATESLHWANRLITEGGGLGITMFSASQRPQKVHKDFVTSNETLIACRVIHKRDRDADKEWVDACGDPDVAKEMLASLASMPRTDAWVYSPEVGFGPKQITWPMFQTYDSFAPQGVSKAKLKGWADVDLGEVQAAIAKTVEEHKANAPKELKAEIARLKADLAKKATLAQMVAPITVPDQDMLSLAEARGFERGLQYGLQAFAGLEVAARKLDSALGDIASEVRGAIQRASDRLTQAPKFQSGPPAVNGKFPADAPKRAPAAPDVRKPPPSGERGGGTKLPKAERSILTALAQVGNASKVKIAVLTRYAVTGGGFNNALGALRRNLWIDDYGAGMLSITTAGMEALGDWTPLPTGDALLQYWFSQLPKAERAILAVLCEGYPSVFDKERLATQAGYEAKGGGFNNALGKLRTLELIERKELRASQDLFG